jgi:hypothetical protein
LPSGYRNALNSAPRSKPWIFAGAGQPKAAAIDGSIDDPVAQRLIEWVLLRAQGEPETRKYPCNSFGEP